MKKLLIITVSILMCLSMFLSSCDKTHDEAEAQTDNKIDNEAVSKKEKYTIPLGV